MLRKFLTWLFKPFSHVSIPETVEPEHDCCSEQDEQDLAKLALEDKFIDGEEVSGKAQ